ncbi:MAG: ABC transporter, partial [Parcubacteria group bacterium GW2011_GWA1_40_21]
GMYVRLAFSVAAHLDPDILIIDEVLAVGDAEFQKKCLGKMEEVTKQEGRTILFVSHNMGAIRQLCNRCVLLQNGKIIKLGMTEDVVSYYLYGQNKYGAETSSKFTTDNKTSFPAQVTKIWIESENGIEISESEIKKDLILNIEYRIDQTLKGLVVASLVSREGMPIMYSYDTDADESLWTREEGVYQAKVALPFSIFKEGSYTISVLMGYGQENITDPKSFIRFNVENNSDDLTHKSYRNDRPGFIMKDVQWETRKT